MIIDSHFHLYDSAFDPDREAVVARAQAAGVVGCILPAIDRSCWEALQETRSRFPQFCRYAVGLHPTSVDEHWQEELSFAQHRLEEGLATADKAVAVGEIGLDAYWSQEFMAQQMEVLDAQLDWAARHNLPLIIHCREAFPRLLDLLRAHKGQGLRGTLHAWSGSLESFEEALRLGDFYMGIGGVVTFKNAHLAKILPRVPLDRLLLETDAPYLTPAPYRGKRNEAAYLSYIVAAVAAATGLAPEAIEEACYANTLRLFNLKPFTL